jgi:poly(3-hydroxybutyrate) depolymerase
MPVKPQSLPRLPVVPGRRLATIPAACVVLALGLSACGGGDSPIAPSSTGAAALPQLSEAKAGTLASCTTLTGYSYAGTTISSATLVADGAVTSTADGVPLALPSHCLVLGKMNPRTGIDGKAYAINFEMRLPANWNGRFFHQVNGGNDGAINTDTTRAYGRKLGGSPTSNGLKEGYAVLSSDAGHVPDASYANDPATGLGIGGQAFGLDPQARKDYGYTTVGTITPMAKGLISAAYGRGPDRSYMVGCSNGGRHGMVAAARYAADYDGILAGDPGFNLPKAAISQSWDSQALLAIAQSTDPVTNRPAIWSAFSAADLGYVNKQILAKCDALDGAADGMVQNVAACQGAFSMAADVKTCATGSSPDGTCLSKGQKTALAKIFGGLRNSDGKLLYADWPWAAGINAPGWQSWKTGFGTGLGPNKYGLALSLSSASGAYIFTSPPADPAVVTGLGATLIDWVMNFDFDQTEALINGTTATFSESAMAFMTPPNPTDLSKLRDRGAKLMVYHGSADPVFSYNDTLNWYQGLAKANGGDASQFARVFAVPGMNHCSGGPATDQFDMLTPLVAWVEKGTAPDSVVATARTAAQNAGLGSDVLAGRTRPLCAWPKVAKYSGSGSIEAAASFSCQ